MKYKYYLNLTTGTEAIFDLPLDFSKIGFCRIQSTQCERLLFEEILDGLDSDLLMHLAMGYTCIIVDYGARSHTSKALRIGLEWIRYYLSKNWLNINYSPNIKLIDVSHFFEEQAKKISKKSRNRIMYFRKFLLTSKIDLIGLSKSTKHDSQDTYHKEMISRILK